MSPELYLGRDAKSAAIAGYRINTTRPASQTK